MCESDDKYHSSISGTAGKMVLATGLTAGNLIAGKVSVVLLLL